MKFAFQRLMVLLAALMLLVYALCWLSPAASAQETEGVTQTAPYVFWYMPSWLPTEYGDTVPYSYVSPFMAGDTLAREDGSGCSFPRIFHLINTAKLEDGAYASIAAYGVGASADLRENTSFRRVSLNTYFEEDTAERIRAVILNAFPRKNVKAIQARANSWLRRQGLPEIVDLQSGEAILAAQTALRELANGGYAIHSLYSGRADWEAGDWLDQAVDTSTAYQQETEHTAQNVESLYNYLYNLEGEAPRFDAVSEASFEDPIYTSEQEEGGTYTVTAAVTLNTIVGERDSLILSAACGGQVQSQPVTEARECRFVFTGMAECFAVKLEINGKQYGGDVYFFEAMDASGTTQPLIGYENSLLPVHAEIQLTPQAADNASASAQTASLTRQSASRYGSVRIHTLSITETVPDIPADNTIKIIAAGGVDTTTVNVIGTAIIGSACILLFSNRNRRS